MYYKIQSIRYTSLKQLLNEYLRKYLSINTEDIKNEYIEEEKIILYKDRNSNKILYTSGFLMRVSNSQNRKAMELASAIAFDLSATCGSLFNVQIVPPGWIHFELTDSTLATWLQSLAVGEVGSREWGVGEMREMREMREINNQCPMPNAQCPMPHAPCPMPNLFAIQYAHARCCSLVLLAHREGLIKLREPLANTSPDFWSVISPNPIPWLNSDGRLRLNHPDEHRLIAELAQVVDNIECPDVKGFVKWEKAGMNLSQAFENFWSNCRIWGEVKMMSPELAQARLGLLMATQSVLKFVLEKNLGVFAPWEL